MFGRKRDKKAKLSKNGRQSTAPRDDRKPMGAVKPSTVGHPRKNRTSDFFSGDVLSRPGVRRYYPFMLYCCLLVIIYIGFVYAYQRAQREEVSCRLRLQQLRSESLLYSSERLDVVRYINLEEEIEKRNIDIRQWNTAPVVIRKDEEQER